MMEATETIQKPQEKGEKKPKKYRAPWEKEGTYKHLHKDIHSIKDALNDIRRTQRRMMKGLEIGGYQVFDQPYIHETVCTNEVDVAVLANLDSAGEDGRLPKDIAATLNRLFHTCLLYTSDAADE